LLRERVSRVLPAVVKRQLRPCLVPLLHRLERPRLERLYRQFVASGDLVFDVGSAEGAHARVFRRLGARVVAIEPQPYCLGVLKRRFADDPGVTLVAAGVADREGEMTLHVSSGDPELSTFAVEKWRSGPHSGRRWDSRLDVPVLTLDRLIERFGRPAFIKVDVEGLEPQVVAGLGQAPRALCFEFTGGLLEDAETCLATLARLGPLVCNASLFRRHRLVADTWLGADELLARLSSPGLAGDVFVSWGRGSPSAGR